MSVATIGAAQLPGARILRRPRLRLMPTLPLIVLALIVLAAVFAPLLTSYDPVRNDIANSLYPPFWMEGGSTEHLLGTDNFGRDVFTRLVYGARVSVLLAVISMVIAVIVGATVGVVAGLNGGSVDALLMRLVDMILALPSFLVALVFAVAVGPSFRNLVLILGFLIWPRIARVVRGETLLLKGQDYVKYARSCRVPTWLILLRHVLPNVLPVLLVATTLEVGEVILLEAGLSFLGAGVPPPQASWGVMIADGRALVATGWWIALFPGLAITVTVLSTNMVGDWIRDRTDPKSRDSR